MEIALDGLNIFMAGLPQHNNPYSFIVEACWAKLELMPCSYPLSATPKVCDRLLGRHHHDFDKVTWCCQIAAQTSPDWWIFRGNPGIPDLVHGREIPHVGDP